MYLLVIYFEMVENILFRIMYIFIVSKYLSQVKEKYSLF